MTDLAALRSLPGALLRAGYVDALAVRGAPPVGAAVAGDLESLPPATATLVRVFYLRGDAGRAELVNALAPEEPALVNALVRLGVLVERAGRLSSGELIALPVFGQLALVPSPRAAPSAYFGQDVVALLARMIPGAARTLLVGAGPGILAVHAAAGARRVVAVEHDPIAVGCAELNAAMNDLGDVIDLRSGVLYEPVRGERFDRVVASAPASPVPVRGASAFTGIDGPTVARRLVEGLPDVLDDGGLAQIAAAWHGGDDGPRFAFDLEGLAAAKGLRVVVTLPSRQPLAPGSRLFESLVTRGARLGRVNERSLRRSYSEHLGGLGADYLYLSLMTISRSSRPGLSLTRHYRQPGGSWFRQS